MDKDTETIFKAILLTGKSVSLAGLINYEIAKEASDNIGSYSWIPSKANEYADELLALKIKMNTAYMRLTLGYEVFFDD